MRTGRHDVANKNWAVSDDKGSANSVQHALLATLMDIREELRAISGRLDCPETLSIPHLLRTIVVNTKKAKKRKRS